MECSKRNFGHFYSYTITAAATVGKVMFARSYITYHEGASGWWYALVKSSALWLSEQGAGGYI